MEQLITEIETYCARAGVTPSSVLRAALNASGKTWADWLACRDGGAKKGPTMVSADRVRAWMAANPPANDGAVDAPGRSCGQVEAAE